MKTFALALLVATASAQDVVGTQAVGDSCNPNGKKATDGCINETARCATGTTPGIKQAMEAAKQIAE